MIQKLFIACLVFLFGCLPTAYGAEEITIANTSPQELRAHLVSQAREANALIREENDAFLIVHTQPASERFYKMWGKDAYLRHLYRFYPQGNDTRVTYALQAVNGDQPASFAAARLGDYRKAKRIYANVHLGAIYKRLILLRKQFDSAYLYGIFLGLREGDTVKIADIIPDTPCAEAGLKAGDEVIRFAGAEVKYASDFELLCRALQYELDARPLTLTILRDDKEQSFTIIPRRCTPEEYASWEKKIFLSDEEMEEIE